jgi:K+ transporter
VSTRAKALVIGMLDAIAWALMVAVTFGSGSDAATRGLDETAGIAVTALFAVTGLPALVLGWRNWTPQLALALGLAFPIVFVALFAATAIYFMT